METLGIYIHIPFCKRKCWYCDFSSYPVDDIDIHLSYILKVIYELRARRALLAESLDGDEAPLVDTIYIGGGTPSFIEAGFITELLDAVYTTYRVTEDAEITIEVNPGTADAGKFRWYRAAGVNRVSIGAQAFNNDALAFLGRIHNVTDIIRCERDARKAGFDDISLDLIFGIPGQSLPEWERDIKAAVALAPSHLSYYSLQIEEGTPLHTGFIHGEFEPADDTLDRQMYHYANKYFMEQGYRQYEISNSAKPGHESRHNLKYWSMAPYIGFGVSAHSYFGGRRFSNTKELTTYLTAEDASEMTFCIHENTLSDEMSEFVFLGLRRTTGIDLSRFRSCFGKDFWELFGKETKKLIGSGLLEQNGDALRLTALGLDLANSVFREYVL